jgi:histone-lysine N-methyltransferase SETMAR
MANSYCAQLANLKLAVADKHPILANRKGVVFHQDSACPDVAITMQEKLRELKWKILSHSPYYSDLASSDYRLFRSRQNSLDGRRFRTFEDLKNHIKIFFDSKPSEFYQRGIL